MAGAVAIGLLPIIIWTGFSIIYYGLILPNTAYAKLDTGIPVGARAIQGGIYLIDSLGRDTLTLPTIVLAALAGLRLGGFGIALSIGLMLDLIYVVLIGGDFMSGRLLAAPFVVAVILLLRDTRPTAPRIAVCIVILAMMSLKSTLLSGREFGGDRMVPPNGIADERAFYFQVTGLVHATREDLTQKAWTKHLLHPKTIGVIDCGGLGKIGLQAGPQVHIIDQCGLADPLLSHLPAAADTQWRTGHSLRPLPALYLESIANDQNRLTDPKIARLYDSIRLITRGSLLTQARLRAIIQLNFDLP